MTGFKLNPMGGWQIKLSNGYILSAFIGSGSYSENYNAKFTTDLRSVEATATCETAIIDPNGNFVEYKGDTVQGYQTVDDYLETLEYTKSLVFNEIEK